MTRRFWAAAAAVSLLAGATGCALGPRAKASVHHPLAVPPPKPAMRVMPLGDSITDGLLPPGGYRSDLWQYMTADGLAADFVGSRSNGPPQLGDRDEEGHPGWRIQELYAHARGWLLRYRPDVVLLHIGTNDIIQRSNLKRAPQRLGALVDLITTTLPAAHVYVATLTPLADPASERRSRAFNAAVPGIVAKRAAQGRHVHLVDMHAALSGKDISVDGIHPTNGGYSKMAARWYSALTGVPMTRWEAEKPAYTTVNNGERLTTGTASGDGKVGYLSAPGSYLEYAVQAPRDGAYRLYVRAGDGTSGPCSQRLTVDGRPHGLLNYSAYGWDQWTITATDVDLRAGRNTVRFSHATCSAEIDAIDLAPAR